LGTAKKGKNKSHLKEKTSSLKRMHKGMGGVKGTFSVGRERGIFQRGKFATTTRGSEKFCTKAPPPTKAYTKNLHHFQEKQQWRKKFNTINVSQLDPPPSIKKKETQPGGRRPNKIKSVAISRTSFKQPGKKMRLRACEKRTGVNRERTPK